MSTFRPSDLPRVALIAGPTASGKSAHALALAASENGIVINADASQVYADLRIVSARPSAEEEALAPHRLFGHRDGAQAYSAADWATEARGAIAQAHAAGRLPILVGGTGLYISTLLHGIAPIPDIDPAVRSAVRAMATGDVHAALVAEDPLAAGNLHPNDTARLQRALEVIRATGRSIVAWRRQREGGIAPVVTLQTRTIEMPIPELYARCDARVDAMIAAGAIEEVAALRARHLPDNLPVMRAIGVAQLIAYIDSRISIDEAIAAMKQATRNYAKRQRTWLRHQLK